jgi:transposase-like protein
MEFCQNNQCFNHTQPSKDWYVKIGYYKPKTTNQSTPRYKCKLCGKSFSTHTNKFTANPKKPEINKMLFKLLVSGVSLRRVSQILNVEYNTIIKHFGYLAKQC